MQIQYLEIVTPDVEATCAAYEKLHGVSFRAPMEIPGHRKFAIYIQGGIHHGLWQQ